MKNNHLPHLPREIDAAKTFNGLVDWVHDELIIKQHAPGFVIGISGTDSILTFLICAKAFEKAGRPERVVGIHYGERLPTLNQLAVQLEENPQAFWFQREIMPWLQQQAPHATIIIDSSINHRMDGQRWGALLDWSVTEDMATGKQRPRDQCYWVAGTRNATEEALMNYSNVSDAVSVQPIIHLWKSEVLKLCKQLNVPQKALQKSCESDCVCGRFELPALNIENVDALLMVRQNQLSTTYVEQNIPRALRNQLNEFIEKQIHDASFKKKIPYVPLGKEIYNDLSIDENALLRAKQSIEKGPEDSQFITAIVPDLIKFSRANAACDLVSTPSTDINKWLPEALMLLGTPRLSIQQKNVMLQHIFSTGALRATDAMPLAACSEKIGHYGFSFPKWRYIAQAYGDNPSLLEQFGMQRLIRNNDIRDASLPKSDPNRDHFGTGFAWNDKDWYIEFRRAYIVCSRLSDEKPITIVIRNNSYHFGRDRLPSPVYVSFQPFTSEELQNITEETLEHSTKFFKWQDIIHQPSNIPVKEKLTRVNCVLNYLDDFSLNLNSWLLRKGPEAIHYSAGPDHSRSDDKGGFDALNKFLAHQATKPQINGRPSMYIGQITPNAAPWDPLSAIPLKPDFSKELERQSSDGLEHEMVLLSGEKGDFPVIDNKVIQLHQARNANAKRSL